MRVRVSEEKDENGKALSATYQDVDENVVLMDLAVRCPARVILAGGFAGALFKERGELSMKEMLEILNF